MQVPLPPTELSDLSASVEINCVAPELVPRVWPLVKSRFADVLLNYPSDTTIEATEADVLTGLQLLWIASDTFSIAAAATTALCVTPARKFCAITLAFGIHTRLWDAFIPMVERYARAEGCSNLRVTGREGWKRVLKDFSEPWIVLDKDLR